jgi:hypothetical protein
MDNYSLLLIPSKRIIWLQLLYITIFNNRIIGLYLGTISLFDWRQILGILDLGIDRNRPINGLNRIKLGIGNLFQLYRAN